MTYFVDNMLPALLFVAIILISAVVTFKLLNRPRFKKGEWVYYHKFTDPRVYEGQILGHDHQFARHWAIRRMDGETIWIYEGDIAKQ